MIPRPIIQLACALASTATAFVPLDIRIRPSFARTAVSVDSNDHVQQALSLQQQQQTSTKPTADWTDDGFIYGLQGSGLERPKGRQANIVVDGDTLETQNYQVAVVTGTFLCHAAFASLSLAHMVEINNGSVVMTAVQACAVLVSSWLLADFGSAVLHWSVDNYGNGRTPIMGNIIAAFQGHHSAPWTITERAFCNNVYKLCVPFGPLTMGPLFGLLHQDHPAATLFLTCFCVLEIMSQEFHKWSHQLPSQTPSWANALQRMQLTIPRTPHAQHHMAPFEGNYAIISGICNPILDQSGFFRRLEKLIYDVNGVEANAWKLDASLRERTLNRDYSLPQTSSKK
jgi:hypothetical protein